MKRRLRAVFTWQVAGPIIAYVLAALLTVSVVEAFVGQHDALTARAQTAAAASRRIDLLQAQINGLQRVLRHRTASDARERGRLEVAVRALAQQIRQMGGTPVVEPDSEPQPTSQARPTPTMQPSSHPTPRPTHPSPKPSPTVTPSPTPTPTGLCLLRKVCLPPGFLPPIR